MSESLEFERNHEQVGDEKSYIEFCLGDETYAIELLLLKEVVSVPECTPIPKAPSYFMGVMNLRGLVITVIDIRKKLNIKPMDDNRESAVMIIEVNDLRVGILVDRINKVINVADSNVQPFNGSDLSINTEFVQGIFNHKNGITIMMDVFKCLDIQDLSTLKKQAA